MKKLCTIPQLRKWFTANVVAQAGTLDVSIEWTEPLHHITFPTGLPGIVGTALVRSEGFADKYFTVTADPFGKRSF